jgi:tRNA (guanine37-N1)-methyltransferase
LITDYKVITLFPELISTWKECGVVNQGLKKGLFQISEIDLRDFGIGNYKQVDDAPYGGGPGMVMMPEPLDAAINSTDAEINIFLTPAGKQLDEDLITELHKYNKINLVCGRYEGFDQRILDLHSNYEIAVGHSVVSGGEVPAMFLMESLIRKIPGVLGNPDSLNSETFTDDKVDYPVYTRPEEFKGKLVPEVLLSGNHKEIDLWKKKNLKDI